MKKSFVYGSSHNPVSTRQLLSESVNSFRDNFCNNSCRVFWQSLSKSFQLPNNPRSYAAVFSALENVESEKKKTTISKHIF